MMTTQSTEIPNYQSIEIPETLNANEKKRFSNKTKCGVLTVFLLIIGAIFARYYIKWSVLSSNGAPSLFRFNVKPAGPPGTQIVAGPPAVQSHGPPGTQIAAGPPAIERLKSQIPPAGGNDDVEPRPPPIGACAPEQPAPWMTVFLLAAYDFSKQFNFNSMSQNTFLSLPLIQNEELASDFLMDEIYDNDVDYLRHVTDKHLNGTTSFDLKHEIYFDDKLKNIISKIDNNFHDKYPITLNGLTKKEVRLSKINKDVRCSHALHADGVRLDGTVREGYEDVRFTAILYLSDYNEFIGGELEFISPYVEKTILAKKGNGLLFSSGIEHLHKVNPIIQGDRYALRILYQN